MKLRPIRPLIFKPVVRWGIFDRDRWWVLGALAVGYLVPNWTGLEIFGFPVALWSWFVCGGSALLFFSWARLRRRPNWFEHNLKSLARSKTSRGSIPSDDGERKPWIVKK